MVTDSLTVSERDALLDHARRTAWLVLLYKRIRLFSIQVALGSFLGYGLLHWLFGWDNLWFTGLFVGMGIFSLSFSLLADLLIPDGRRMPLESYSQFQDVRAVGSLAELLAERDPTTHQLAERALLPLLPQLKSTDSALLTIEQRVQFHNYLTCPYSQNPDRVYSEWEKQNYPYLSASDFDRAKREFREHRKPLALALLNAYQKIGIEYDLPTVRTLAEGFTLLATDEEIQSLARECLPVLEMNIKRSQGGDMLLRASDYPIPPDELLRPLQVTAEAETDKLLRPMVNEMP